MNIGVGQHTQLLNVRNGMPFTGSQTGWKGKPTSEAAAHHASLTAPLLRDRIIEVMKAAGGPMTADEVAKVLRESILSIRPRISELARAGRLIDTGERGRNASGRSAMRWRVSEREAQA